MAARGALQQSKTDTVSIYRNNQWREASALILREYVLRICEVLKPGTFIELGAHGAEASIAFIARVGGRAIAFEANPFTFESVTCKAVSEGVIARNLGVGAAIGTLDMHIPLLGESKPITAVQSSFLRRSENVEYQTVSVDMTTLNAICSEIDISSGVFLWVDVEGLALEVLNGGLSILDSDQCVAVMVEVESIGLWENQSGSIMVDKLMTSFGFVPVMRDAEYELQYNVVYVKEALLGILDKQISEFWSELSSVPFHDPRTIIGRVRAGLDLKGRFRRTITALSPRTTRIQE